MRKVKEGKICPVKSYCMSILMYGEQLSTQAMAEINRLIAAEMRFFRSTEEKTKRRK
jgi:hypothetical protein